MHYYVERNESGLDRKQIQMLCYTLCHFYFNWAGPIKVPAPLMYAHKVADYFMTIRASGKRPMKTDPKISQAVAKAPALSTRLHFL